MHRPADEDVGYVVVRPLEALRLMHMEARVERMNATRTKIRVLRAFEEARRAALEALEQQERSLVELAKLVAELRESVADGKARINNVFLTKQREVEGALAAWDIKEGS